MHCSGAKCPPNHPDGVSLSRNKIESSSNDKWSNGSYRFVEHACKN